jgi:nucleoside-diphosphate-sugar epimerase
MPALKLVITGSQGDVGEYAVKYARQQGADVLAVDNIGRGDWQGYISADLNDLGQVYDVLHGADAVIHLAAISDPYVVPAAQCFTSNVRMTYNVLEAAARLGIRRVVLASSIQLHHPAFPREPIHYDYLPFDEEHPVNPHDEYGLAKQVGEACADNFAHHWGLSVVSLRITWSIEQAEMQRRFPMPLPAQLPTPRVKQRWLPTPFYIEAWDCARACYLAATVDLPPATHIPLIITARDSTYAVPTREVAQRFFPQAQIRSGLDGFASIASGARAEQVLGFVPQFSWREDKGVSHE